MIRFGEFLEAAAHGGIASLVAPIVGITIAALLDWFERRQDDALVRDIRARLFEGILGGYIEGLVVSLIVAGLVVKHV